VLFIKSHRSSPRSIPVRIIAAERNAELLPGAMKSRPNGIGRQLTGKRDLVVAQTAEFAHQEHITIDGAQAIECFTECDGQRLCGRQRWIGSHLNRLTPSSIVSHMVECEIPGDAKEPGAPAAFIRVRHSCTSHPEEYLLGQLARVFASDDAAEVTKDAFAMRGEEDVSVGHEGLYPLKTPRDGDPLTCPRAAAY
jgi:hypothetical protein